MTPDEFDQIKNLSDVLVNVATILALIVGGTWTYYNFFYRRTFNARLEVELEGRNILRNGTEFLLVNYAIKNVGMSRFRLKSEGAGLVIARLDEAKYLASAPAIYSGIEDHEATVEILATHDWIESGETVAGSHLLAIPTTNAILWSATLVVVSSKGIQWVQKIFIERSFPDNTIKEATSRSKSQLDGE